MSKGPGRTMRAVEALLTGTPQAIAEIARHVYGVSGSELTRAQVESVRRACKRLSAIGRAHLGTRQARVMPQVRSTTSGRGSNPRFLTVQAPEWNAPHGLVGCRVAAAHHAVGGSMAANTDESFAAGSPKGR